MADYYVNQKIGNDANSGLTELLPFETFGAFWAVKASGDVCYVDNGVYNEGNFQITDAAQYTIVGIGKVIFTGASALLYFIATNTTANEARITARNIIVDGYTVASFYNIKRSGSQGSFNQRFYNCIIDKIDCTGRRVAYKYYNCVFKDFVLAKGEDSYTELEIINNTFLSGFEVDLANAFGLPAPGENKISKNIFNGDTELFDIVRSGVEYLQVFESNTFTSNSMVAFNGQPLNAVTTQSGIADKYLTDTSISNDALFSTTAFHDPIYNNTAKGNYTLGYDLTNNPLAFATFNGNAIGAYEMGSNSVCKTTGNAALYSTDTYSLGFTNVVGAIDDVGERLYRTADGVANIGAFRLSGEFIDQTTGVGRAFKVENWQGFGTVIDRNGGQVSINPSDFPNNYQIDVLIKWSTTLTEAALIADTSIQFVRFRLRPNETNYYVDNVGTLIGDGEPTYLSLVDSSDGGSGVLVPQNILAKSYVVIAILQDA